jgi:hypothetical protein
MDKQPVFPTILVKKGTTPAQIKEIEYSWELYQRKQPILSEYKQSGTFAHLHLDIIDGTYVPGAMGDGEPVDYFEIEIGNQICYSTPMGIPGSYFDELQDRWLPYYDEKLRLQRFAMLESIRYHTINGLRSR